MLRYSHSSFMAITLSRTPGVTIVYRVGSGLAQVRAPEMTPDTSV